MDIKLSNLLKYFIVFYISFLFYFNNTLKSNINSISKTTFNSTTNRGLNRIIIIKTLNIYF